MPQPYWVMNLYLGCFVRLFSSTIPVLLCFCSRFDENTKVLKLFTLYLGTIVSETITGVCCQDETA